MHKDSTDMVVPGHSIMSIKNCKERLEYFAKVIADVYNLNEEEYDKYMFDNSIYCTPFGYDNNKYGCLHYCADMLVVFSESMEDVDNLVEATRKEKEYVKAQEIAIKNLNEKMEESKCK